MTSKDDQYWMRKAIKQAQLGHTPFGAVIVNDSHEYVEAYNTTKQDGPIAHAEINVIQKLKELDYANANKLRLYSTVEPCPMCMSAIVWAGIGNVIYGASLSGATAYGNQIHITCEEVTDKSWYTVSIKKGIEKDTCVELLKR